MCQTTALGIWCMLIYGTLKSRYWPITFKTTQWGRTVITSSLQIRNWERWSSWLRSTQQPAGRGRLLAQVVGSRAALLSTLPVTPARPVTLTLTPATDLNVSTLHGQRALPPSVLFLLWCQTPAHFPSTDTGADGTLRLLKPCCEGTDSLPCF